MQEIGGSRTAAVATRRLVIVDANSYWTEQIFRACAPRYEVLLVKPRDLREHLRRHRKLRSDRVPCPLSVGLYEQNLGLLPGWMFGHWWLSENRIVRNIKRFASNTSDVLVFNYPQYRSLLERIPHRLSLYYNTDDYTKHWPGHENEVQEWERNAVREADVTICISAYRCEFLKRHFPDRADRLYHVPIGCSPEFMVEQVIGTPRPLPESLSDARRPVVGYIGALNWRFDFEYLRRVADNVPSVTFALGGRIPKRGDGDASWWHAFDACRRMRNIHFLGPVLHSDVGRCLQSFDALMMIYSDNEVNRCACPAKLWDYLGTSLPIIANDVVPEVLRWRDVIYVCSDPEVFSGQLTTALSEDRGVHGNYRLSIAREHTWPRLGGRIMDILESHLHEATCEVSG